METIKTYGTEKMGALPNQTFNYEDGSEVIVYHQLNKITVATNKPLTILHNSRINNTLKKMHQQFKDGKLTKRKVDISNYGVKIFSC